MSPLRPWMKAHTPQDIKTLAALCQTSVPHLYHLGAQPPRRWPSVEMAARLSAAMQVIDMAAPAIPAADLVRPAHVR